MQHDEWRKVERGDARWAVLCRSAYLKSLKI